MLKSRLPALDLLRFIAVFLVVARHSHPRIVEFEPSAAYDYLKWGGWTGVDMFFVLSGFLVSGLLFNEYKKTDDLNVLGFLVRRGFKIYPAFYAFLLLTMLWEAFTGQYVSLRAYLVEGLFLRNYFNGVWGHTWSLDVEEHFYILLPVTLLVLHKVWKSFALLPAIFGVIAVVCLILRLNVDATEIRPPISQYEYFQTHLRIDSLLFGVLISYYYHFYPKRLDFLKKNIWFWWVFAIILLIPSFIPEAAPLLQSARYTANYISFGLIMMLSLDSKVIGKFMETRVGEFIGYLGQHSYSTYLWHVTVIIAVEEASRYYFPGEINSTVLNIVHTILIFIVGVGTAKIVEFPMLAIRDRYFPRGEKSLPTQQ
jgi:peptidoglycan/LPS O-acetylase OafA/YrhL